jgi:hypothetical protein
MNAPLLFYLIVLACGKDGVITAVSFIYPLGVVADLG